MLTRNIRKFSLWTSFSISYLYLKIFIRIVVISAWLVFVWFCVSDQYQNLISMDYKNITKILSKKKVCYFSFHTNLNYLSIIFSRVCFWNINQKFYLKKRQGNKIYHALLLNGDASFFHYCILFHLINIYVSYRPFLTLPTMGLLEQPQILGGGAQCTPY